MKDKEARSKVSDLWVMAAPEWQRLGRFRRYLQGHAKRPWLPENVEAEYLDLARKSASNWLRLVIEAASEGLIVTGYGDSTNSDLWDSAWQANGMDARQHSLTEAALSLGYSYLIVMPGEVDDENPAVAAPPVFMRPEAATNLFALYDDPDDEWPIVAIRRIWVAPGQYKWELYTDTERWDLRGNNAAADVVDGHVTHNLGVVPIVKVRASHNLMSPPVGEIEPVITIQDRIIDATFSLQMVAKYGAFPQRWIAGMQAPDADDELAPKIKAYVDHILMSADPDTQFGQFQAADLSQYVNGLEAHIHHLAAISQTPAHYLFGEFHNLSADAIAALEAGYNRKTNKHRSSMGEGYEQAMRLAGVVLGDDVAAKDTSSQVTWTSTETRALGAVADAIQKLSTVGVPMDLLLKLIPGLSQRDIDAALVKIEEQKAKDEKALADQNKATADAAANAGANGGAPAAALPSPDSKPAPSPDKPVAK